MIAVLKRKIAELEAKASKGGRRAAACSTHKTKNHKNARLRARIDVHFDAKIVPKSPNPNPVPLHTVSL